MLTKNFDPLKYGKVGRLQQIQQDMRLSYALMLFKQGKVSISKAAELAGMNLYAFMAECKQLLGDNYLVRPDDN